jgi:dihydrofolate reductase
LRKVFLHIFVSLDGLIEDARHDIEWMAAGDDVDEYINEVLRSIDGMIFGRVAHELLAQYWPTAGSQPDASPRHVEAAAMMNKLPKYVVSRGPYRTDWQNSHLITGDIAGEIAKLKDRPGKDIALFAGAGVAQSFMKLDLLDEYRLVLNPILLGAGTPLFKHAGDRKNLELVRSLSFACGATVMTFRPAAGA